ncbi:MAG: L-2-hydroxyglutarate oxidase [Gammaproteobacteria bacterium]|nr:L-2-hydroxyglutarate oxidase [Gammaproteobacteria bacterium]
MASRYDYIVIGAGIIGLATARRLQQAHPAARIALVEKEQAVARHQSSHNSGVIHAGVYYPPGSLKATYCRQGVAATLAFCAEHGIPHRQCGKLVVATDAVEAARLRHLAGRARENGLDCEWLERDGIAAREPAVNGVAALFVRDTGIADYPAVCARLAELFTAGGGELLLGQAVKGIAERADGVNVEVANGPALVAGFLAVCGGLQADRLARLAGLDVDVTIVPFRGDYYRMPAARSDLVSTLIYPVPDPRLPFLGVHLTLTTDGGITIGPTAMLALARERYAKWAVNPADLVASLGNPGTWRLLARFPRAGLSEVAHALSRRLYLREAQRYCPSLTLDDLATHACGIRAQAVTRSGDMVHDFLIEQTARSVHVLNAPSPAATSAFPIAAALVERITAARA